jgi:hypothetical protein
LFSATYLSRRAASIILSCDRRERLTVSSEGFEGGAIPFEMSDVFQAASQSICMRQMSAMATLCDEVSVMATLCEVDQRLTNDSPKTFKRTKTQRRFSKLKHLHLLPGKSSCTNTEDEE